MDCNIDEQMNIFMFSTRAFLQNLKTEVNPNGKRLIENKAHVYHNLTMLCNPDLHSMFAKVNSDDVRFKLFRRAYFTLVKPRPYATLDILLNDIHEIYDRSLYNPKLKYEPIDELISVFNIIGIMICGSTVLPMIGTLNRRIELRDGRELFFEDLAKEFAEIIYPCQRYILRESSTNEIIILRSIMMFISETSIDNYTLMNYKVMSWFIERHKGGST